MVGEAEAGWLNWSLWTWRRTRWLTDDIFKAREGASLTRLSRCGQLPWSERLPTARPCAGSARVWTRFRHRDAARPICCRRCRAIAGRAAWATGMEGAGHRQSGRLAERRLTVEVCRSFDLLRSLYSMWFSLVKAGYVLSSTSIDPCLGGEGVRLPFSRFFPSLIHSNTRTQTILSALFSTTYFSNFFSFLHSNNRLWDLKWSVGMHMKVWVKWEGRWKAS